MSIPNEYHFIFGLVPDFGGKPFSFIHYLSIVMCHAVNRPQRMTIYYAYEPSGVWWERARPYLELVPIKAPTEIFGRKLTHPAHMADVKRLEILVEKGGIYLDLDVLCIREFAPLRSYDTVLGEEYGMGLCNAVILARPQSEFLKCWFREYRDFSSDDWNGHSVRLPRSLANLYPQHIHVVDHKKFFSPLYKEDQLKPFFLGVGTGFCSESYCFHLWESLTWSFLEQLTPRDLLVGESEFCQLTKGYVDPRWG